MPLYGVLCTKINTERHSVSGGFRIFTHWTVGEAAMRGYIYIFYEYKYNVINTMLLRNLKFFL